MQMIYRSGRQTAQKQLLDHYQVAGRNSHPDPATCARLHRDRAVSERDLELS
jgi:hypothetical protein